MRPSIRVIVDLAADTTVATYLDQPETEIDAKDCAVMIERRLEMIEEHEELQSE